MKNHRFLWLRNRTTNNRKCEKARNIKEKRTIEMFSMVSRLLVVHHSSARDNQLFIQQHFRKGVLFVFYCAYSLASCGSSQHSCSGGTKNSPPDCFLNAPTVLKEIIISQSKAFLWGTLHKKIIGLSFLSFA